MVGEKESERKMKQESEREKRKEEKRRVIEYGKREDERDEWRDLGE